MKIHLNLDEELLNKRVGQISPLLFGIAWEENGVFYPDKDWIDFGIVLIGWWFRVAFQLSKESPEGLLSFMDGPYSIKITFDKQTKSVAFEPEGLAVVWKASIEEFRKELIRGAEVVHDKLLQMNIDTESQVALRQGCEVLKSKIEKERDH